MKLGREIDLWLVNTDQPAETLHQAQQCLDQEEMQSAAKFLRPELQTRFIFRRATLRKILAHYLDIAPIEVAFQYTPLGKPTTESPSGIDLQFNLSHSGPWAAIVVCSGSRIGIDIERIREMENAAGIVERFYSAKEWLAFSQLPENEKNHVFLKSWTCKEAYLKATGDGLSFPLDRVEISIPNAVRPPQLANVHGRPNDITNWSLIEFPEHTNLIGSIVVEGSTRPLRQRTLELN